MYVILNYLVPFFAIMGALVFVHEFGHYIAARMLGIKVTDFAIGMGPTLYSRKDRSGCTWRLCALPIGGYVKMLGDGDASSTTTNAAADPAKMTPEERKGTFRLRPPGHRAIVVGAGPFANFVFAFIILFCLYVFHGHPMTPPIAADVLPGSPAAAAGIKPGDRILAVDDEEISKFEEIVNAMILRGNKQTEILLERDGEIIRVTLTPEEAEAKTLGGTIRVGRIGIRGGAQSIVPIGPAEAARLSLRDIGTMSTAILRTLKELVTMNRPLEDMGGPVKIAEVSGDAYVNFGLISLLGLAALISVNLGIMNLLPIPVLDGGHLLIYAIEAIRGRPANEKVVGYMFKGGAAALLAIFAVITVYDVTGLINRIMG